MICKQACWLTLGTLLVVSAGAVSAGSGTTDSSSTQPPPLANHQDRLRTLPALMSDKAATQLLTSVTAAGARLVAVGERGHIVFSDDQGDSWAQAQVPVQLLLTAVDFVDAKHGWAVGHEATILYSADGGESWAVQYANPYRKLSDDELDQLTDAEFMRLPQAGSPLLDVYFQDAKVGYSVGAYGMFLCTTDGGVVWRDCAERIDNPDGWHLNAIGPGPGETLVIAGEKGTLLRSDDAGQTWDTLTSPYGGTFFGLLPAGDSGLLVFGLQGKAFRSDDAGVSWDQLETHRGTNINSGTSLANGDLLLVGNSGLVLRSADGREFEAGTLPGRQSLVDVIAVDDDTVVTVGQAGVRTQPLAELMKSISSK